MVLNLIILEEMWKKWFFFLETKWQAPQETNIKMSNSTISILSIDVANLSNLMDKMIFFLKMKGEHSDVRDVNMVIII